jgi:hypothetical protein
MAIVEFDFVLYPANHLDREAAARWVHERFEKAGLAEHGLAPLPYAAPAWSKREALIVAGSAVLTHRGFMEESDDDTWAVSLYYLAHDGKAGVVGSVPTAPFGSDSRSKTWPWLVRLLDRIVETDDVDLGFVNGHGDDDGEDEGLPNEQEIEPPVPRAVTVWNYYGPSRLTPGVRKALAELPSFSSQPLGKGWLLRPVDYFSDPLPPKFLSAYERIAGGPVRFLRGELVPPRPRRSTSQTAKGARSGGRKR